MRQYIHGLPALCHVCYVTALIERRCRFRFKFPSLFRQQRNVNANMEPRNVDLTSTYNFIDCL